MKHPPLIAISGRQLDSRSLTHLPETYGGQPIEVNFSAFAAGVIAGGGLPLYVPYAADSHDVFTVADGLILTGGQDVVLPRRDRSDPPRLDVDPGLPSADRDDYELRLFDAARAAGVPVLGICRGHQLLNVALGGTLIPDLPARLGHLTTERPPTSDVHEVEFVAGTLAESLYGRRCRVNSWHHQAVDQPGPGVLVSGRAPDGVIEAIEVPDSNFLGVQWHPEWQSEPDPAFNWVVSVAQSIKERQ